MNRESRFGQPIGPVARGGIDDERLSGAVILDKNLPLRARLGPPQA